MPFQHTNLECYLPCSGLIDAKADILDESFICRSYILKWDKVECAVQMENSNVDVEEQMYVQVENAKYQQSKLSKIKTVLWNFSAKQSINSFHRTNNQ